MFEGTTVFLWSASSTDWPEHHTLWGSIDVEAGSISIWLDPAQRITAVFKPNDAQSYAVISCPIVLEAGADLSVAIRWKEERGDIFLEGQLAGTSKPGVQTANRIVASPRFFFCAGEAFAEKNERYRLKRHDHVSQITPKKNRRLVSPSEELDQLRDAAHQLSHLTSAVSAGHTYLDTALADRLRALICRFKGTQSYPMLQRIAGRRSLPLIMYALPFDGLDRNHPLVNGMVLSVLGPVSVEQIRPEFAAMDIDVWLELRHVSVKGEEYTNNTVIRAVADTEGSHYDASVEPLVDALRSLRIYPEHVTRINSMLINVGRVVLALAERVLEKVAD